jgi:hypothetical protein
VHVREHEHDHRTNENMTDSVYESTVPYEAVRINAAAVYCSDGRIGLQIDEFLQGGLKLPRYDRLACPGGPVALAGTLRAFWESRGVEEQLRFLIQVHELHHVVLVAHEGCAYYRLRMGLDAREAERQQRADLQQAAAAVQRLDTSIEVAGFFAHLDGSRVWFERVFASEGLDTRLRRRSSVRV